MIALRFPRLGQSVRLLGLIACLASGCVASEKSRYVRHLTHLIPPSEVSTGESLVAVTEDDGGTG